MTPEKQAEKRAAWPHHKAHIRMERTVERDCLAVMTTVDPPLSAHAETPELAVERLRCKYLGLKCCRPRWPGRRPAGRA